MINKPPPLNREYNMDPNMKALKRRGFINQGSTLGPLTGRMMNELRKLAADGLSGVSRLFRLQLTGLYLASRQVLMTSPDLTLNGSF